MSSGTKQSDAAVQQESRLWPALKAKRLELARSKNLAPYHVFHDKTLIEIHNRLPLTVEEFGQISGVGATKLADYASHFLGVVVSYLTESGYPLDTLSLTEK